MGVNRRIFLKKPFSLGVIASSKLLRCSRTKPPALRRDRVLDPRFRRALLPVRLVFMIILRARLIDIQSPVSVPARVCRLFPTATSHSRRPAGISCSPSVPPGHLRGLQLGTGKAARYSPIPLLLCFIKSHLPPRPFASRPHLSPPQPSPLPAAL